MFEKRVILLAKMQRGEKSRIAHSRSQALTDELYAGLDKMSPKLDGEMKLSDPLPFAIAIETAKGFYDYTTISKYKANVIITILELFRRKTESGAKEVRAARIAHRQTGDSFTVQNQL